MRTGPLGLIASLSLIQFGCHGSRRAAPVGSGGARLTVADPSHDFGHALTHDELAHSFQLQNTGGAPLEIGVEAGHECSVVTQALSLNANAHAELRVTCRPDQYGAFMSTVILHSSDPQAPRVVLELLADVEPRLAWKQPVLALELKFGEDRQEGLELIGARARDARLSVSDTADAGLGLEITHHDAGDRLEVRAPGHPVGTRVGELKVATGLDDPAELGLPFSYTVTGTLTVTPSNPYFDLLTAKGRQVELNVVSSQPGFRVLAADVLDGPFRASFSGSPGGAYRVETTFLPERASAEQRGTLGHLRLRSNDRSEPEKVLTLMAFGKALPEPNP